MDSVVLGDWHHRVLGPLSFQWKHGQRWLIAGPNGSGKSALAALWAGRLDAVAGRFERHKAFVQCEDAWIGFERQRLLLEWQRHIDLSDVQESPDPGTLVKDFVGSDEHLLAWGLERKGERGLKHLSTGELRRACLARAMAQKVPFLLLDEPLEGLDVEGAALVQGLLETEDLLQRDAVYLTRRPDDVPRGFDHRLNLPAPQRPDVEEAASSPMTGPPSLQGEPVIAMNHVRAGYGDVRVFDDLSWTVRQGDRWLVTGPNGSGKSTLLALLFGDHPQVFSNDIELFGRRRGPELTLAQLRRRVGLVSYSAHLSFRNLFGVTGLEVVASGFAGTVGLWNEPSYEQVILSRTILEDWGLSDAGSQPWESLSWGTQRVLLLARALVSSPEVLLLDEPCQGLDAGAQRRVLNRVALWANDRKNTLIYVTHRTDEVDESPFLRLRLVPQGRA